MDNENEIEEISMTYKPLIYVEDSTIRDYCNPMVGDHVLDVCFNTLVGHALEQLKREREDGGRLTTNVYNRLRNFASQMDLPGYYSVPAGTLFLTDIVAAAIRNLTAPVDATLFFTAPSGYAYMACSESKAGNCVGIDIIVRSNRTEVKRDYRTRVNRGFRDRQSVREWITTKWCQACQDNFYEPERTEQNSNPTQEE